MVNGEKRTRSWTLGVAAAIAVLAWTAPAAAQGAAPAQTEGWAYELANYLMSPFCPGKTLSDCPSPNAASLRMWIVVQEAAGRTRADVEEELYERYGEVLRPAPKVEGFGATAYIFPVVAFLAGGVGVAWFLMRQTRQTRSETSPPAAPLRPATAGATGTGGDSDTELARLIDEELAR